MGLLDFLTTDKDQQAALAQGLLSGAFGAMAGRGTRLQAIGQGGLAGMQGYAGARDQQMQEKRAGLQDQLMQLQLGGLQRQQAQQEAQQAWLKGLQSPQALASQAALAGGGGPTASNATKIAPVDPMQQMTFEAVQNGALPFSNYLTTLQKDNTPLTVKEGEALVDRKSFKPIFTNPKNEQPSDVKEYQFAKGQGYAGTFEQWARDMANLKAPKTSVNVSMDKGFGDVFAKNAAEFLSASKAKAQGAASTLRTLDQVEGALNTGNVITGPVANAQVALTQVAQAVGIGGKDTAEKLANTRKLMQGAASLAVDGAAAMAGQGQITDKERELVNRMAGGNVDQMTVPEIRATLGVLRKVNQGRLQQHQEALKNVGPEFSKFTPFYQVDTPTSTVAPSVDDLVNKYRSK